MDRPQLTPEQIQADNEKLDQLREVAGETFGYDSQFAYFNKEGKLYIMSFDEAIQICGHFIASETIESVVKKLQLMHDRFWQVSGSPNGEVLQERGRENSRQKLAEWAISSE